MLKTIKKVFRKKLELKTTPGESIRDAIIEAGIKAAQESEYVAGNSTEKIIKIAENLGTTIDRGTKLFGGSEAAGSLGRVMYKTTADIARGDVLCTGLCAISGACETIALGCSTIKIIPFRGEVYIFVKIVSKGCMSYRNICAGNGC